MIIRKKKNYQSDVEKLYRKHQFHYIWYSNNRVNEFGNLLHNKLSNLEEEGIQDAVPYKDKLDRLYEYLDISQKSSIEPELLHSALYFFLLTKCIMV
jgi:ATP-dependent exoDNAse (exonuclease V) beta subunit